MYIYIGLLKKRKYEKSRGKLQKVAKNFILGG